MRCHEIWCLKINFYSFGEKTLVSELVIEVIKDTIDTC